MISESCTAYFSRNPYDGWFRKLDYIISGTSISFYNGNAKACHLDLIPYATARKWTALSYKQRTILLNLAGDTLALLLRDSPVKLMVLNGSSVVKQFEEISGVKLEKKLMRNWSLPRRGSPVKGFAYKGVIRELSGIDLGREIAIFGFNHNIQSSFGVTREVTTAIKHWIADTVDEAVL